MHIVIKKPSKQKDSGKYLREDFLIIVMERNKAKKRRIKTDRKTSARKQQKQENTVTKNSTKSTRQTGTIPTTQDRTRATRPLARNGVMLPSQN